MELAGLTTYKYSRAITPSLVNPMDSAQTDYIHEVLDKMEQFIEDVYDMGLDQNIDQAWILTALLHSSAQIAAVVAVTSAGHNSCAAGESADAVIKFITNHVLTRIKEGVLN